MGNLPNDAGCFVEKAYFGEAGALTHCNVRRDRDSTLARFCM